jgi:large subunit ribosomal protein L35
MPKLKTKKGVAKRFKWTKKGKIKYPSCGKSHLATGKETKRKRHLRKKQVLEGSKAIKYLKRMSPYA